MLRRASSRLNGLLSGYRSLSVQSDDLDRHEYGMAVTYQIPQFWSGYPDKNSSQCLTSGRLGEAGLRDIPYHVEWPTYTWWPCTGRVFRWVPTEVSGLCCSAGDVQHSGA